MLQYRLQPVGNFRCDYATGADFCDAFVTRTGSQPVEGLINARTVEP